MLPVLEFRFDDCKAFKDAVEWYESLKKGFFLPNRDLESGLEYATARVEHLREVLQRSEDKSDSLLKTVLAAVAVVAAVLKTTEGLGAERFWLYFSLVVLAMAALFCIAARKPIAIPTSTDTDQLLKFQMSMPDKGVRQGQLAAAFHVEAIGLGCVIDHKAQWNDWATRTLMAAVLGSLIALWPVVAGPGHRSSQDQSKADPKHAQGALSETATPR